MTHRFGELMFTPHVQAVQHEMGSRSSYARLAGPSAAASERLGQNEATFIAARDSFYLATVSETGWPYVQHRGGPPGFIKLLDDRTIGFADYRGNKQYVSVGNLVTDDRVSLIFIDYPHQRRLKILGHARIIQSTDEPDLLDALSDTYPATIERGMVISIDAFDWNCPQHITPRFSEAEIEQLFAPLQHRIEKLEAENAALKEANRERGSST